MIAPAPLQAAMATLPNVARRPHAITQTIVLAGGSLATIVVAGGRDGPETGTRSLPGAIRARLRPRNSSSDGLTATQTGIIVGCLVGALVLGLLLYFCVATTRRRAAYVEYMYRNRSFDSSYYTESGVDPQTPLPPRPQPTQPPPTGPRPGWPSWRPTPPPVVPTYRAKAPPAKWKADARASATTRR